MAILLALKAPPSPNGILADELECPEPGRRLEGGAATVRNALHLTRMNDGKNLESLAHKVFSALTRMQPGSLVEHDVQLPGPDGSRQIDVLIRSMVGGRIPITTIIECKDYKRLVNVTALDALHSKMQDVRANKAILVARKGFSGTARQKADRLGITLGTLNNPDSDLAGVGLELPLYVRELVPIGLEPSFRFTIKQNQSFKFDSLFVPGDVNVLEGVRHAILNGGLSPSFRDEEIVWAPSELRETFIRSNEGPNIPVTDYEVRVRLSWRHLFGYVSDADGLMVLEDLSEGTGDFVLDDGALRSAFPRLREFDAGDPSLTAASPVTLNLVAAPVIEFDRGDLKFENIDDGSTFSFGVQRRP